MAELVVLNGVCAGTVFVLPEIPTVLGRSPESHLQIGDPWVSSMHAMFERRGDEVWLVDLDSRNGTFLGEERVTETCLVDGAVVRFGKTDARFSVQALPPPTRTPVPERPRGEGHRDTIRTDGTLSVRPLTAREPEADPYALALRPAVILRLSLQAAGVAGTPDAATRIRAALELASRAALDEGGVVGRLAAAGLLALFGLTGTTDEDAARALRAARVARESVRALGGLDLRAGLDAGPMLAGTTGGPAGVELAALGAPADRAERLAALAAPGEILVGAGAAAATGATPLGARELGGSSFEVFRAPDAPAR